VRSILALTVLAALGVYGIFRALPESTADAESSHTPRPQEIESIALDGRGLETPALRAALATKVGDQLDRARLERDRGALEDVLVSRGYLDAKVQSAQITFDADGGALVTFAIAQGRLFHVRSAQVTGASPRDAGVVTIAAGEPVDADRLSRARDALAERLVARGKRRTVSIQLATDESNAAVDVQLVAR
jgi:outer membrane protein assembly factor BamA